MIQVTEDSGLSKMSLSWQSRACLSLSQNASLLIIKVIIEFTELASSRLAHKGCVSNEINVENVQ